MTIVFMGVSGCGKTTVGKLFVDTCGGVFLEGDDFHPPENVEKMRSGQPLDDADRADWLRHLRAAIVETRRSGASPLCVTCSALKASYRDVLRGDDPPGETVFAYLKGDRELLRKRMENRVHRYMPASLLDSQLRDLEEPEEAIVLDISMSPADLVALLCEALGLKCDPAFGEREGDAG